MKTIAIICAMEKELSYLRETFAARCVDGVRNIYEAEQDSKKIVLCISGIGKVNSAACTQYLIDRYSPDCVINVGIAGGLSRGLSVLDMVIAENTMYHDFHPLSLLEEEGRLGTYVFKCDRTLIDLALTACVKLKSEGRIKNYTVGRVVSGDCFVEDDAVSARLRGELGASCVEMEGASISHVCLLNEVPFLVLRSISDFADNNAEMSYDTFAMTAARQAGETLLEIIKGL